MTPGLFLVSNLCTPLTCILFPFTRFSLQQIEASSVELSKMLTLKPFVKRPNPILGGVRFLAFFFMTTMMFSVFVAAFPLRLMVRIISVTFARTFVHASTHAVQLREGTQLSRP